MKNKLTPDREEKKHRWEVFGLAFLDPEPFCHRLCYTGDTEAATF